MNRYPKREIHNLARFISVMKFHPLSWRVSHPYILVDRFEDVTPPEQVRMNKKCDRNVLVYGYLRGCNMKKGTKVCILRSYIQLQFWNIIYQKNLSNYNLEYKLYRYLVNF